MAYRWALYLMITTTAAYPAAPLDLPPLGQTGLTDASMKKKKKKKNNNNNNNCISRHIGEATVLQDMRVIWRSSHCRDA